MSDPSGAWSVHCLAPCWFNSLYLGEWSTLAPRDLPFNLSWFHPVCKMPQQLSSLLWPEHFRSKCKYNINHVIPSAFINTWAKLPSCRRLSQTSPVHIRPSTRQQCRKVRSWETEAGRGQCWCWYLSWTGCLVEKISHLSLDSKRPLGSYLFYTKELVVRKEMEKFLEAALCMAGKSLDLSCESELDAMRRLRIWFLERVMLFNYSSATDNFGASSYCLVNTWCCPEGG